MGTRAPHRGTKPPVNLRASNRMVATTIDCCAAARVRPQALPALPQPASQCDLHYAAGSPEPACGPAWDRSRNAGELGEVSGSSTYDVRGICQSCGQRGKGLRALRSEIGEIGSALITGTHAAGLHSAGCEPSAMHGRQGGDASGAARRFIGPYNLSYALCACACPRDSDGGNVRSTWFPHGKQEPTAL